MLRVENGHWPLAVGHSQNVIICKIHPLQEIWLAWLIINCHSTLSNFKRPRAFSSGRFLVLQFHTQLGRQFTFHFQPFFELIVLKDPNGS